MRARSKSASAGFDGFTQPRTILFESGNDDAAQSAARAVSICRAATAHIIVGAGDRSMSESASARQAALLAREPKPATLGSEELPGYGLRLGDSFTLEIGCQPATAAAAMMLWRKRRLRPWPVRRMRR
jgi:hypothetical protein